MAHTIESLSTELQAFAARNGLPLRSADEYTRDEVDEGPREQVMMPAQHTPGPWLPHAQGDADDWCLLTADGRWVIAFRQNGELLEPVQRANMRLVGASPDLLEALRAAAAFVELYTGDGCRVPPPEWARNADGDGYDANVIAQRARAAIDQATRGMPASLDRRRMVGDRRHTQGDFLDGVDRRATQRRMQGERA